MEKRMSLMQEALLIERFRNGDTAAISDLFEQNRSVAYAYAMKMTKHSEDASDVVSEAFVRAYKGIHSYDAKCSFRTWLYAIIKRCFLDSLRRRQDNVYSLSSPPADRPDLVFDPAFEGKSPLDQSIDSNVSEILSDAFGRLPADSNYLLNLYHVQHKNYDEIAKAMGVPITTIKSRLHRGRTLLKKIIRSDEFLSSALLA